MSYRIEKVEFVRTRPNWLRKILFLDLVPSIFEKASSIEDARQQLKKIEEAFKTSSNTKPRTQFELQQDCLHVVSKSHHPVISFQITSV